jgi:hypothetical protein
LNITTTALPITLDQTHYTVIVTANVNVTLPAASSCRGKVYIVKKTFNSTSTISSYQNINNGATTNLTRGVIAIQSDGTNWQQIN